MEKPPCRTTTTTDRFHVKSRVVQVHERRQSRLLKAKRRRKRSSKTQHFEETNPVVIESVLNGCRSEATSTPTSEPQDHYSLKSSGGQEIFPVTAESTISLPSLNKMTQEEEFSYASLRSMWSQRDKETRPLKVKPPTMTTPPRLSARSPERRRVANHIRNGLLHSSRLGSSPDKSSSASKNGAKTDAVRISMHNNESVGQWQHNTSTTSSRSASGSYDQDITKNLKEAVSNNYNLSTESLSDEENIMPTQLWQESDESWSVGSGSNGEVLHSATRPEPVVESFHRQTVESSTRPTPDFPPKSDNDIAFGSSNNYFGNFDPYDNFESMSTANSEVTLRVENKQATAIMNALQRKKERFISTTFDEQHETDSNIPDSAFQSMAAKLTSNITGAKSRPRLPVPQNSNSRPSINASKIEQNPKAEEIDTFATVSIDSFSSDPFGSLYHNVPRGPQTGVPIAESDVFDGLSDTGSAVPAFGKDIFTPSEEPSTVVPVTVKNTNMDRSQRTIMGRSHKTGDQGRISEKSEAAKKKLSQNLANFTKSNKSMKKSNEGKINLSIPRNQNSFKRQTLESVGEECESDISEDIAPSPARAPVGISRIEENDSSGSFQDLSRHFERLRASPKKSPREVASKPVVVDRIVERDDSENIEDYSSHADVKYPAGRSPAVNADIARSVTWMPSMLRLYKKRASNESEKGLRHHRSPDSVMNFSKKKEVTVADCRLNGLETILLNHNPIFGGRIERPEFLINSLEIEVDESVKHKLRFCVDANSGVKRIGFRRKKKSIFDKAIEVHERAMSLLETKKLENSLAMYERFFECYARKEFVIDEKLKEKEIISVFLFNMGMVYLKMDEYELALEFFNESMSTLEQIEHEEYDTEQIIGITLNEIGIARFASGSLEEALEAFADALALWQDLDNTPGVIRSLNNIGCTYFALNEFDSALEAFEETLEIQRSFLLDNTFGSQEGKSSQSNDELKQRLVGVSQTLFNMAYTYKATGSQATTRFLIEEVLTMHKTLSGDTEKICEIEDILSVLDSD